MVVSKRWLLDTDADSNGVASPGDTLRYHLTLRNDGNQAAAGVALVDIPDSNTPLVVGSVQTSTGVVTLGNSPGDGSVEVNVGTLPAAGGTATITFRVTIVDPLPPGVTTVHNQAQVTGDNFPATLSDDPTTAAGGDPTVTAVTAAPPGQRNQDRHLVHRRRSRRSAGPRRYAAVCVGIRKHRQRRRCRTAQRRGYSRPQHDAGGRIGAWPARE